MENKRQKKKSKAGGNNRWYRVDLFVRYKRFDQDMCMKVMRKVRKAILRSGADKVRIINCGSKNPFKEENEVIDMSF